MNRDMHALALAAALTTFLAPIAIAAEQKTASGSAVSADAEALSIVATVDKDEIAAAKQAQGKKLDVGAMDYARMMERDHKENLDETRALSKQDGGKDMSADAKKIHDKNAATLARIGKLDGAEYQAAYVDAMVKGHGEVLAKLDNELIPGAKDAKVKAHLQKTRAAVSTHLDHAKVLQAKR